MTHPTHAALILSTMRAVSADRLQKAVCGLADGSFTVTLTRQTDSELRALVKNGSGAEYGVTLTEGLTSCSCKDALYRDVVCKHVAALALHTLRTSAEEQPKPARPLTHLLWSDGTVLCGEERIEKVWTWPWPETILNNTTHWPEVALCQACLTERNSPGCSLMQDAA